MPSGRARDDAVERALGDLGEGVLYFTPDRILDANPALCRIVGRTREQVLDLRNPAQLLAPSERDAAVARLRRYLEGEGVVNCFDTQAVHADGHAVDVSVAVKRLLDESGPPAFVAVIRDTSEAVRSDRSLRLLVEASDRMASSSDEIGAVRLLAVLAIRELADGAAVAVVDDDGQAGAPFIAAADPAVRSAIEAMLGTPPDPSEATGRGRVLRTGRTELALFPPVPVGEAPAEATVVARQSGPASEAAHARAILDVALPGRGRILGVMSLVRCAARRPFDSADARLAEELARRASLSIERWRLFAAEARARDDAEAARRQLAFIAEATELLGSAGGAVEAATRLARHVVPALADWCAVDVVDEDGSLRRVAAAHRDPVREGLLWEIDRLYPVQHLEGHLRSEVLRTGEPLLIRDVSDESLADLARDPTHATMLRELGIAAAMWLPLASRGATFGVVSLGLGRTGRTFSSEDEALAEELAARGGEALDRARAVDALRRRERQHAAIAELGRLALQGTRQVALGQRAAELIAETLEVPFAEILEPVEGQARYRLVGGVGWNPGHVGVTTIQNGKTSHAGFTIASGSPVIVEDLASETRFRPSPLLDEHHVTSGLTVAIRGQGGQVRGAVGAHDRRRRRFTADDVHVLEAVANILANAADRRAAEDALRDSEQQLEVALDASQTATWDWEIKTGVVRWSVNAGELHGVGRGDEPGTIDEYLRLIHPDDRNLWREAVQRAERDGQLDTEYRIVWPDGTVRWIGARARVFYDQGGRAVRLVGTGRDVTDRRVAEQDRDRLLEIERKAAQLRETFIGVLSHELRTPITTIFAGAKLLSSEERRLAEETRRELVQDIEAEADRLYRIVEDLLVLTRAERGTVELGAEPVLLSPLLQRIATSEARRWPDRDLRLDVPPGLPAVRADDTYVEQVVRNLLGNAAKYGPPGSTVELSARRAGDEVEVRVLDRGPGFPPDEADRLFEVFYRSSGTPRNVPGAGIGLFVVHQLIEAMGGRIWARPRDGGGAEFGFALRVYAADD